jgi:hypothetical protein
MIRMKAKKAIIPAIIDKVLPTGCDKPVSTIAAKVKQGPSHWYLAGAISFMLSILI